MRASIPNRSNRRSRASFSNPATRATTRPAAFIAQWTDRAETVHRYWARAGEEILRPFSANAHLASALDIEPEEVINTAFGPNLPRLCRCQTEIRPKQLLPGELQRQARRVP